MMIQARRPIAGRTRIRKMIQPRVLIRPLLPARVGHDDNMFVGNLPMHRKPAYRHPAGGPAAARHPRGVIVTNDRAFEARRPPLSAAHAGGSVPGWPAAARPRPAPAGAAPHAARAAPQVLPDTPLSCTAVPR